MVPGFGLGRLTAGDHRKLFWVMEMSKWLWWYLMNGNCVTLCSWITGYVFCTLSSLKLERGQSLLIEQHHYLFYFINEKTHYWGTRKLNNLPSVITSKWWRSQTQEPISLPTVPSKTDSGKPGTACHLGQGNTWTLRGRCNGEEILEPS